MTSIHNIEQKISQDYAFDLVSDLQRYINEKPYDENDKIIFDDLPLLKYILESKNVNPISIVHRILYYFAYHYHFLYLYDDWDWISDIKDFTDYVNPLLEYMDIKIPHEFQTDNWELIYNKKKKIENDFLEGLKKIGSCCIFHRMAKSRIML